MFKGALELSSDCICRPGAIKWIEIWFKDCVYSSWDLLGFLVGLSSVFFWMIAQMPQFLTNILRQSAEALSPWFLFQWLAGDSLNLLGCVLTGDQLSTETFTAYYFIFADCIILSQYFYYHARNTDRVYFLDESLHKPSNGYQTAITIHSERGAPEVAGCSSAGDGIRSTKIKTPPPKVSEKSVPHFGIMARGERFQDFEEEKLKHIKHHQIALPKARKSMAQTCNFRRQLRRIVMEYGLEYGPASVSRLTTQHALRLSQIQLKHSSGYQIRLKKALCLAGLTTTIGLSGSQGLSASQPPPIHSWTNRKLLMLCTSSRKRLFWVKQTGTLFGWVSAGLYLGSRVSQLVKNNQRKSAEGLSLAMVSCAVLANLTYGAAILIRLKSWKDLMGKAPWILGSLGTVSLDIGIFLQAQYLGLKYRAHDEKRPNESTPLLS